jgi:predicted MFS family arabinose efflux permease
MSTTTEPVRSGDSVAASVPAIVTPAANPPGARIGRARVLFFATTIAIVVLSLYASQPLIGLISLSFHLPPSTAALVPTVTLLGYAVGLMFLVPPIDLLPNRRLVITTMAFMTIALTGVALAPTPTLLFVASALVGFTSTVVQMLVSIVAGLASDHDRGRIVGTVQVASSWACLSPVLWPAPSRSFLTGVSTMAPSQS